MNLPEIKEYRIDVEGKSKENLVTRELIPASDIKTAKIVVPKHAPFFIESVNIYVAGQNTPLKLDEDYDFVSIDHDLSEYAGAKVSWVFRKLKPLPDLEMTYQTLGTIPALTHTTKNWYEAAALDQRPVWFDQILNRPRHYIPRLHGHDLNKGFYNLQKMVEVYQYQYETLFGAKEMAPYRDWFLGQLNNLQSYIEPYRTLLNFYVGKHIDHMDDPHHTLAKDVPGLEHIQGVRTASMEQANYGDSDKLRTVAEQGTRAVAKHGFQRKNYAPMMQACSLDEDLLSINNQFRQYGYPFMANDVFYGATRMNVSAWVTPHGEGLGLIEVQGRERKAICWLHNPNPMGGNRLVAKNQWRNTNQVVFKELHHKVSEQHAFQHMISGGNAKGVVLWSNQHNAWVVAQFTGIEASDPLKLWKITGDVSDLTANHHEYTTFFTDDTLNLIRTVDYDSRPTVIWRTIPLSRLTGDGGNVALESYRFRYTTVNDGTAYNEQGKVVLFPRGFAGGKYTNGDLVLSEGVDVIEEGQQIQLMYSKKGNKKQLEFFLPETFKYKDEVRRYTHQHMAEFTINHSTKEVILAWVEERSRPYLVTSRLFSQTPDAANYFDQVATPFPTTLASKYGSLVGMEGEGYFAFGFTDHLQGDTFATTLVPEMYVVGTTRRQWNLDGATDWVRDRVGQARMVRNTRVHLGHHGAVQPYMGAAAESTENQHQALVKGYHAVHGLGYFTKSGFIDMEAMPVAGTTVFTSEIKDDMRHVGNLHPSQWIGSVCKESDQSTQFLCAVSSKTSKSMNRRIPDRAIPYMYAISGEELYAGHYVLPTDPFLAHLGVTENDHWTLVLGRKQGLPDFLYVDRVAGNTVTTRVVTFKLSDAVLSRVDMSLGFAGMTILDGSDRVAVLTERTVTHAVPAYLPRKLVEHPEDNVYTNSVSILDGTDGRLVVQLNPNNQVGDASQHMTFPTTLVVTRDGRTIVNFEQATEQGSFSIVPGFGWSVTNWETQRAFGGLVNAGKTPDAARNKRLRAFVKASNVYAGLFNIMPVELYVLRMTYPFDYYLDGNVFHTDTLSLDLSQVRNYGGSVEYSASFCLNPDGVELEMGPGVQYETHEYSITLEDDGLTIAYN